MTDLPTDRTRLAALALAVSLVGGGLAGAAMPLLAPTDPAPATTPSSTLSRRERALAAWNFTGFTAQRTVNLSGAAWIDVAIPATMNTTVHLGGGGDIRAANGSSQPNWLCYYVGIATVERYPQFGGRARDFAPHYSYCRYYVSDGTVTASATVNGKEVRGGTTKPWYSYVSDEEGSLKFGGTVKWDKLSEPRGDPPRPVIHFTVAIGGGRAFASGAALNLTVENTVDVRVRTGPSADVFQVRWEAFSAKRQVWASTPGTTGVTVTSNTTYRARLLQDKPHAVFWWRPPHNRSRMTGDEGHPGYIRPNGTRPAYVFDRYWSSRVEATNDRGTWTFHVPGGAYINADRPVLMGLRYERAALPYGTPHFADAS